MHNTAKTGEGQAKADVHWIEIPWRDRRVQIEYRWIEAPSRGPSTPPLIVFLHEGLGSVSMWRDFPDVLCSALGARGLVWSRPGYGRSTPRAADETWGVDFMHRQAFELMPAFFSALGVGRPVDAHQAASVPARPWLFGHSDGGSIALLYASRHSEHLSGLVVLAPHILVEAVSIASIQRAKIAYQTTDLRAKLAKHHQDPDSAFWGWNQAWLNPDFARWSIEADLASIRCPVLAIQGVDDEYGTLEQIRGIAARVPDAKLLELAECGHSPHRDRKDAVIEAVAGFIGKA